MQWYFLTMRAVAWEGRPRLIMATGAGTAGPGNKGETRLSPKILIVDDDVGMRETLADIFADQGFEVELAEDGAQAVGLYVPQTYSLVLMDIRMPNLDGVEALRRIRQLSDSQPVVLMTAYSVDGRLAEAEKLGPQGIFTKPLDWPRLLHLVSQLTES